METRHCRLLERKLNLAIARYDFDEVEALLRAKVIPRLSTLKSLIYFKVRVKIIQEKKDLNTIDVKRINQIILMHNLLQKEAGAHFLRALLTF